MEGVAHDPIATKFRSEWGEEDNAGNCAKLRIIESYSFEIQNSHAESYFKPKNTHSWLILPHHRKRFSGRWCIINQISA